MQLWFSPKSSVTLREQLVTQIILAILSDDLRPGQRLPSTRELARRFRLHPNTVSAGYRLLSKIAGSNFAAAAASTSAKPNRKTHSLPNAPSINS